MKDGNLARMGSVRRKYDPDELFRSWMGRPHSSLGYATPAAFAAELKKQGAASLRIAGGYATQPLASPAHVGENDAEALIATG